ncbi:phosphohydrolase [Lysinibacillus sp. 2017]|uniref:HD domain-containing protein n=1 Tax=unclassified Lysinibacillus TaxID=2636778 RepID=UPI000D529757|nr:MULTISPECIES: HD domain-containing protein [unclassified Lysinibacillus]AWE06086.1 phosphohydrolase [Lysinibacillus sp. 2017]TGN33363.1 HD domain-containing protein [Lysinibacillus sp. S2017]
MNLVDQATQFIAQRYEGKHRTVMQIPYAAHLFGVARILKSEGYHEAIVTAGLLHDLLEDGIATEQEIEELFGQNVLLLVKSATELPKTYEWQLRKEEVIARIGEKSEDELAILLAEKIYNLRSIIVEINQFGDSLWTKFNAPKEKQEWYYRSIVEETMKYHPQARLLPQLVQVIDELFVNSEHELF